jgi:molecular chaperone DnaK
VINRFSEDSGLDIGKDAVLKQQLRDQVERAKIELSGRESALIALPFIGAGSKPVHLQYTVTRAEFEELIAPLLEKTIDIAGKTLEDADCTADTLILSGGSSRIPMVQRMLEELLHVPPQKKINPDEVVALGAAIATGIESGKDEEVRFSDVTPLPLGVEIEGGRFMEVVKRNSPVPSSERKYFTTVANNQRSVEVHVLQGTGSYAEENTSLGRFLLSGIAEAPKGDPQIEVTFHIDEDGILHVEANDRESGAREGITISRDFDRGGEMSEEQLRETLRSLIRRTEALLESAGAAVEPSFVGEVRHALHSGKSALEQSDRSRMEEHRIVLETIVSELQVLGRREVSFGSA